MALDLTNISASNGATGVILSGTLTLANDDPGGSAASTYAELRLKDKDANYTGFKTQDMSGDQIYTLPAADGSNGQQLTTNGSGVLSWASAGSAGATAADDIGAGDAAVSIATSAGNITIDAQGDNTDIIFKGTDDGSDITFLTMDGSESSLLIPAAQQLQFRDTGLYIASNADGDLDIVSDGTAVDSINIESAGGITLDAGTNTHGVTYEDDGTAMLRLTHASSDACIVSLVQDKDILFKGNDGGSAITALQLDMSDAGRAVFNDDVRVGVDCEILGDLILGAGANEFTISESSDDITITVAQQDKDLTIVGNDGGSSINALVFDMSDAGKATFKGSIVPADNASKDLGASDARWANIYTSDMHFANERGDWTLIEESDFLSFRNNKTGRRYKMVMEDITDSGDYGPDLKGNM